MATKEALYSELLTPQVLPLRKTKVSPTICHFLVSRRIFPVNYKPFSVLSSISRRILARVLTPGWLTPWRSWRWILLLRRVLRLAVGPRWRALRPVSAGRTWRRRPTLTRIPGSAVRGVRRRGAAIARARWWVLLRIVTRRLRLLRWALVVGAIAGRVVGRGRAGAGRDARRGSGWCGGRGHVVLGGIAVAASHGR